MTILVLGTTDVKAEYYQDFFKGYFIRIKGLIHQEGIKNLNIYIIDNKIHEAETDRTTEVD